MLKRGGSKEALSKTVGKHTRVVVKNGKKETVLSPGVPIDHSAKHLGNAPQVGCSLGVTLNMDNYQSLRVDTWMTDVPCDGETVQRCQDRVFNTVYRELVSRAEYVRDNLTADK